MNLMNFVARKVVPPSNGISGYEEKDSPNGRIEKAEQNWKHTVRTGVFRDNQPLDENGE